MLIITRKPQEEIVITYNHPTEGEKQIKVLVTEIKGKQARIGIKADRAVDIQRGERFTEEDWPGKSKGVSAMAGDNYKQLSML